MTPIEQFAKQYRLRVRLDECGDQIIPGRRGESQLYFDGKDLCLMVLNGPPANVSRWRALGGKLWMGDISQGLQDVKVVGIPPANARGAIAMAMVKPRRTMSEKQRAVLDRARAASPLMGGPGRPPGSAGDVGQGNDTR